MVYSLLRPLFFALDPEHAHQLSINALKLLQASRRKPPAAFSHQRLAQDLWGLRFPNPVGLAAGYDKNAAVPLVWSTLGFGFAELGTITAKAQPGNPKPRIFRLARDRALINRLGFNNEGVRAIAQRLPALLSPQRPRPVPLGFNIGKSKVTRLEDAAGDYLESCEELLPFTDYLVVNVSSPNTPELRKLQEAERLGRLLEALLAHMRRCAETEHTSPKPLLVKIAPDLSPAAVEEIARLAVSVGVSGLIATNTTVERPGLRAVSPETGGLSGRPLAGRARAVLRTAYRAVEGKLPLIGVGGIFSAEEAYQRIRAGASLVQIYTGMIYEGPFLAQRIVRGLIRIIERDGLSHLRDAVGRDA